jgi:hypothetical protein
MKKLLLSIGLAAVLAAGGTALADDAPPITHFTMEAQNTNVKLVGLMPEGLRFVSMWDFEFVDGWFAGTTGALVDHYYVRHDGVMVLDMRGYAMDPTGTPIIFTAQGYLGDPTMMPGLEAYFDPDFEPPDFPLPLHGVAWFQSMAPEYAFVNHTIFGFRGTLDPVTNRVRAAFRSLAE